MPSTLRLTLSCGQWPLYCMLFPIKFGEGNVNLFLGNCLVPFSLTLCIPIHTWLFLVKVTNEFAFWSKTSVFYSIKYSLSLDFHFCTTSVFVCWKDLFLFVYESLQACLFVQQVYSWCLRKPEQNVSSPGIGMTGLWVLGTEPGCSARASCSFNCQAVSVPELLVCAVGWLLVSSVHTYSTVRSLRVRSAFDFGNHTYHNS